MPDGGGGGIGAEDEAVRAGAGADGRAAAGGAPTLGAAGRVPIGGGGIGAPNDVGFGGDEVGAPAEPVAGLGADVQLVAQRGHREGGGRDWSTAKPHLEQVAIVGAARA
jgi:hypothetical protein